MVICSRKSRKKVFHSPNCGHARRIGAENRLEFETPDAARAAGYTRCSCCSRLNRFYRREKDAIRAFCTRYGLRCFQHDGKLYCISLDDVAWRVIPAGKNRPLFILEHESLSERRLWHGEPPHWTKRAFHRQKGSRESLLAWLEYIVDHDMSRSPESRRRTPKPGGKKARALLQQQRARERRRALGRVYTLISCLTPDYAVPEALAPRLTV